MEDINLRPTVYDHIYNKLKHNLHMQGYMLISMITYYIDSPFNDVPFNSNQKLFRVK